MSNDLPRVNACIARRVDGLLKRMCLDKNSRNYGGFVDAGTGYADSRNSIYDAQDLFAVYAYPDFPEYYAQDWLLEKLRAHLVFMQKRQRKDGTVNLWIGGAGTGNEVGFTLPGVTETYRLIENSDLPGRDEILQVFKTYILRGAEAVRNLFPHTANHRWAACTGPLAVVNTVFPDDRNVAKIEEYLSDGIDINADGLYYEERSPNYNNVADWGLMLLADYYNRPDLLKLIERNLRFILQMIQPNGEAETLFSHRQDRGAAHKNWGDYYIFKRLAVETGDGTFATAADLQLEYIEKHGLGSTFISLRRLFDNHKHLIEENTPREPLPATFEHRYAESPLWRFRNKQVASTVSVDAGGHFFDITQGTWGGKVRSDAVMSYHVGDAIIDMFKIRWGSGTGGFRPEKIEYLDAHSLRLSYVDPGWPHLSHFRPKEKWGPRHYDTDVNAEMTLTWTDAGAMTVNVKIGGWEEMPINIQLLLRETNRLITADGTAIGLQKGGRTFTDGQPLHLEGSDGSRILIDGLPASEASIAIGESRTIPGIAENRCHRLIAALFTPVDVTFTLTPEVK